MDNESIYVDVNKFSVASVDLISSSLIKCYEVKESTRKSGVSEDTVNVLMKLMK